MPKLRRALEFETNGKVNCIELPIWKTLKSLDPFSTFKEVVYFSFEGYEVSDGICREYVPLIFKLLSKRCQNCQIFEKRNR